MIIAHQISPSAAANNPGHIPIESKTGQTNDRSKTFHRFLSQRFDRFRATGAMPKIRSASVESPFLGAAFSSAKIAEEKMRKNRPIGSGEDKPNSPGNP